MKVKNIMFSGFAAAILMGVAAEANAAPVAVASKGYVDSVAGKLVDLDGAADEATNLVEAINVKLDPMEVLNDAVPDGKYYAGVAQTAEGKVSVVHKDLADVISSGAQIAPTTAAVWNAIQNVRGDIPTNVQGEIADGEYTTTTGFFNKVTQTDGKVSVEEKAFDTAVNATTGVNTDTAPTTKAVYDALTLKQNVITDGEDTTTSTGFISEVKQDNGTVTSTATAFDTAVNATTGTHTSTAPTTKAVYDAIQNVSQQIPDMPAACSERGVTCVLTSEGGEFAWAVLTTPVTDTTVSGTQAQAQTISEPVTGGSSIEVPNP